MAVRHGRLAARDPPRPRTRRAQRTRARRSRRTTSTWAATRTTCSRKSSSSRSRLRNAMRGRLDRDAATAKFGGLNLTPQQLRSVDRLLMTACGTSWHAALVGEYQIETLARIPVEVEYASELRYRNPPIDRNTLVFAITQSGETADTLARAAGNEAQGPSRRWRSATWWAAPSPRRPTAASTCTPGRRSAWPRPRRSRRSAWCWPCWPCTSAACGT